jgi:hypothetical protein
MITMPAKAQVYINGQLIEGQQLLLLQMSLGEVIPPGNYWVDTNGNWGYAGNSTPQGNLNTGETRSNSAGSKQHSSYYSQGGAGGYGSYASDGECSIISIEGMSMTSGNC